MSENQISSSDKNECEAALRRALEGLNDAIEDIHNNEPHAFFESMEDALNQMLIAQRVACVSILK